MGTQKPLIFRVITVITHILGVFQPFNFMGFGCPMVYHFCHTAPARILNNFVASMVGVLLFQVHDALRGFRGPERPKDPELESSRFVAEKNRASEKMAGSLKSISIMSTLKKKYISHYRVVME